MIKKILFGLAFLLMLFFLIWVLAFSLREKTTYANLDEFAKCLGEKEVVMYGAEWCSHCTAQKKMFGESFEYISYVECSEELKVCSEKEIQGVPTWEFQNGEKLIGEQTIEKLSQKSGCPLPK